jgi:hypothetical protein
MKFYPASSLGGIRGEKSRGGRLPRGEAAPPAALSQIQVSRLRLGRSHAVQSQTRELSLPTVELWVWKVIPVAISFVTIVPGTVVHVDVRARRPILRA